jgi:hypothetical protein
MSESLKREREEDINFDEIAVDCFTTEYFFLRRYSCVKGAHTGTRVPGGRIMDCCMRNRNLSISDSTAATSVNNLIFRFIIDDPNDFDSSALSSRSVELNLQSLTQNRRQVDNCVIIALKEVRQDRRQKTEDSNFIANIAVNCMGADGAFMRRFTDPYHASRTLQLDTLKLRNAMLVKNTIGVLGGFYFGYYQGDNDPLGPGEGEVRIDNVGDNILLVRKVVLVETLRMIMMI